MTLIEFMTANLDADQQQAEKLMRFAQDTHLAFQDHKRFLGRVVPGWHTWPDVEAICGRVLADVTAKRAALDLHRQIECVNCEAQGRKPATSCWRCHHGDSDMNEKFYDGTCSTVRALAQAFEGRPGWQQAWEVKA